MGNGHRKREKESRGEEIKRLERDHALMVRDLRILSTHLDKWIEAGVFPKPSQPISPVDVAIRLLDLWWRERIGRRVFQLGRLEVALAWRGREYEAYRGARFMPVNLAKLKEEDGDG
jgi:hypothetical protein